MTATRTLDGRGRRALANVALGESKADTVVRGGRLVNVYTGEIYDCDVAVSGNRVAAIGEVGSGPSDRTPMWGRGRDVSASGIHRPPLPRPRIPAHDLRVRVRGHPARHDRCGHRSLR